MFVTVIVDETRNERVPKLSRTVAWYSALRFMLVRLTEPGTSPVAAGAVEGGAVLGTAADGAPDDGSLDPVVAGDPAGLGSPALGSAGLGLDDATGIDGGGPSLAAAS